MQASDFWALIILALLPCFEPYMTQRILMAENTNNVRAMFRVGAGLQVLFCSMVGCAGLAGYLMYPGAEPMSILLRVIQGESQPVLLGICVVGLLAAIMSTADSVLNAASICLSRDICKSALGGRLSQAAELRLARYSTLAIGLVAAVVAIYCTDIRELILRAGDLWVPVAVIPLWAGILGYRASSKVFFVAVATGQLTYWGLCYGTAHTSTLGIKLTAMLANGLAFWAARKWEHRQTPPAGPRRGPKAAKAGIAAHASNSPKAATLHGGVS
jgi:SSS family solute:Na+ symporter